MLYRMPVFDEMVKEGKRPVGIRIDSGDLAYLTKKARKMLDEAGFSDCKIVASNSLDENIIRDMILQGAQVDSFGVGERLITAASTPVFGGVYKIVAVEENGVVVANTLHMRIAASFQYYRHLLACCALWQENCWLAC